MKKDYRIRKNEEFSRIIAEKNSTAGKEFIIYASLRREDNCRIGISVSKKLGKAVIRNKIKRQLRMMLLNIIDFDNEKYDYIVIVRPDYLNHSFDENKKGLENTIKKVKIKRNVKR